jgi:RNA polymerase sigma-70 factor (ECF subfamily)
MTTRLSFSDQWNYSETPGEGSAGFGLGAQTMAVAEDPETEKWLCRAREGDQAAVRLLLDRYRGRLRRMIGLRLDERLASRLDASDVVQDTLIDAVQRLETYLRERPLPFYPWLHRLASERLAQAHRYHLRTLRRQAGRELAGGDALTGPMARRLVDVLVESGTSPSGRLIREEDREAVWQALGELSQQDREILVMRYLEQLAFAEIATILSITDGAARLRHYRALQRIGPLLDTANGDPEA